jgi:hypothetical protein
MTTQSSSNKSSLKKEDCGKNGTYTGQQQAKNYSTGLRKSLNSSFMTIKITTSKRSSTVLPPRPPLITPCGKLQKDLKESLKLLQRFASQAFANHLTSVFQPHPPEPDSLPEDTLTSFLETPFQLEPLIQRLKRSEVQAIIKKLPPKKSPGYDLMTGKILKATHPLHPIPNPALQCYITQRLISHSMESGPDNTHPEAWQTPSPTILLQAH